MSSFELNELQTEVQQAAREYARDAILPSAAERDRTHEFPTEIIKEIAGLGFMGMYMPESYGGAGMDFLSYAVALEEISYADASVGVAMSVNNSLVCAPLLNYGTEEQKQKYLPRLTSGESLGCYALTEPHCGSDAAALRARATPQEDGGYVLDGRKMWITNGPQADLCVAYATTTPELAGDRRQRTAGIVAFVLESDWAGYNVGKIEEKMGLCGSGTSALVFEGLKVPASAVLGEVGGGFQIAMATLDGGRIGIAAQALGIAQRAFDISLAYAKDRESMGKSISRHQAIQWMLADMACRIESARMLTWRAASMRHAAEEAGLETLTAAQRSRIGRACSMAKLTASEAANFCADRGVQIHGGYGFSKEYEIERLYRDARITTLYEGTSEIQRMVIAGSYLK